MFKQPLPGENHGHIRLVARFDDLKITFGTAWLDYPGSPFPDGCINTVSKWEEPIRNNH